MVLTGESGMTSGSNLVAEVAALLEDLHWTVKVEQPRDGIQVDILAQDPNGREFVVECKAYSKLAGLRTVREFASAVEFFRETSPDLQALLVTTQGFTPNAQKALARHRLLGQTVDELRGRFPADRNKLGERVDGFVHDVLLKVCGFQFRKSGKTREVRSARITQVVLYELLATFSWRPPHSPPSSQLGLIQFRGHIPKGGYEVHDGSYRQPA